MGFDWRGRLKTVPHEPGVYLMRDRRDAVVYVGKAADLHSRLRSYFQRSGDTRFFIGLLGDTLGDIQTQEDGTVQVEGSLYFANLGAGGRTYILERVDGEWRVAGDTGVIWMS